MSGSPGSAADHEYSVFLLGAPELRRGPERLLLRRRQVRALFYFLAHELKPVTRERLTFLFWPDRPDTEARRNLTRLLSAARAQLDDDDLLVTAQDQVGLDARRVWSDYVAFAQLCLSAERAALEEAARLYRGPFLEGFALPDSPAFGEWQDGVGWQLERDYLALLSKLIDVCQEEDDLDAAIGYARRYLALDELAEEAHRRLIGLYAMNGDRAAAAQQFETCALILERELGVRPLPETRAAYEAAMVEPAAATSRAPAAPVWNVLPSLDLPLIGREAAWHTLSAAYERLKLGGLILVAGEPGVGKTRLMQEFATSLPTPALAGSNLPGAQNMAYTALMEALRQALSYRERWEGIRPIWVAEVGRLLPELAELYPDLPPPLAVEPAQAQARLFEGLGQCFVGLARHGPLLLCLDDVHWADAETLGWVSALPRRLNGSGLCILATCRSEEAQALAEVKRAFARANLLVELALTGLTEEAVGRLLKKLLDGAPDPQLLAERMHHATGGNAFFVLETVRTLLEAGPLDEARGCDARQQDPWQELPLASTVEAAIRRRLDALSPLGRQMLETAAVLEIDLRLEYMEKTAGRSDLEVAQALDELVGRQLLVDGGTHFSHDLVRQVTYESISSWRRRILHRRAALAVEGSGSPAGERSWAAIARHYDRAGESANAFRCYERAAAVDVRLVAHEEAVHHLRRAIELAAEAQAGTAVLSRLKEALADNLLVMGTFSGAEMTYRQALDMAPKDDLLHLAELERKIASTLPPQRRSREAKAAYDGALARLEEALPAQRDERWQAQKLDILLGLLDALYFRTQPDAMAGHIEETQALLDAVGTVEQQVNFYSRLNQIAFLRYRYRAPEENTMLARKALARAQETGNPGLVARQQFHLGFHLLWHNDLENAENLLRQGQKAAEAIGDYWLQNQCLVYLTIAYRLQGKKAQVASLLPQLVEVSQHVGYVMYVGVSQATRAWLHFRAAEWQEARAQAEAALESWAGSTYPFQWLAHWLLLDTALREDRVQDALPAARAMIDDSQQKLPDDIEAALEAAIAAWESGEEDAVRGVLERAAEQARRLGYL